MSSARTHRGVAPRRRNEGFLPSVLWSSLLGPLLSVIFPRFYRRIFACLSVHFSSVIGADKCGRKVHDLSYCRQRASEHFGPHVNPMGQYVVSSQYIYWSSQHLYVKEEHICKLLHQYEIKSENGVLQFIIFSFS